ncbi:hypothetical protein Tco_1560832 [Tanacetum coccineum]
MVNALKTFDEERSIAFDEEVARYRESQRQAINWRRRREACKSKGEEEAKIALFEKVEMKEAEVDDDQEEVEMKKHMEIVIDEEEVTVNAIPLATKTLLIFVEVQIVLKEGRLRGESRSIVKAKHGNIRPEEEYKRVLWGDLKVIFEPDIESEVWRSVEGHNATVWKLFDSRRVHSVRFKNLHIFMLVEKKYPLTPAIITSMLNKKLQVDQWNE